jgi:hypothetical protein
MSQEFIPIFPPHYKVDAVIMDVEKYEAMKAEIERLRAERDALAAKVVELRAIIYQLTEIDMAMLEDGGRELESERDALRTELAAVRAEKRYVPVDYSTFVDDQSYNDTYLLVTLGGTQLEIGTDPTEGGKTVNLPSDMRLCRLVTEQGSETQGESQQGESDE